MIYLLYHRGYPTGRGLSDTLLQNLGTNKFTPLTTLARLRTSRIQRGDTLIRWGSTRRREKDEIFLNRGRVLNSASAILRNTNKENSLRIFKDAGLNTPRVYLNKYDIKKFPVLGRDRHHHGGKDIVVIKGSSILGLNKFSKIPDKDFYSEFLQSKEEYRVHVFCGEVVRVTRKVYRGQTKDGKPIKEKSLIRNDTYGWGHQNVAIENLKESYADSAIRAVAAIGLDFGAVDLLICSNDGLPYVLEVNSSPSLNSIGLENYSNSIEKALFPSKEPREKKKGKYFWS